LQRITDALLCSEATCRLSYPVVDSIPVMLIDQASELSSDDWQSALNPNNGAGS
jgi:uncharacterized protein YbaR (Trm112 family)